MPLVALNPFCAQSSLCGRHASCTQSPITTTISHTTKIMAIHQKPDCRTSLYPCAVPTAVRCKPSSRLALSQSLQRTSQCLVTLRKPQAATRDLAKVIFNGLLTAVMPIPPSPIYCLLAPPCALESCWRMYKDGHLSFGWCFCDASFTFLVLLRPILSTPQNVGCWWEFE